MRYLIVIAVLGIAACSFEPGPAPTGVTDDAGVVDDASGADDASTDDLCPVDGDDDGYGIGPDCPSAIRDCDDSRPERSPGAPEVCNGVDDNCDGTTDEGCTCIDGRTQSCGSDVGACASGTQTGIDGAFGPCIDAIGPVAETCNGVDDNCDGTADEGCSCTTGETRDCGETTGACEAGTQECIDGTWGTCNGAVGPESETCNGIDDNCDGDIDNGVPNLGGACNTGIPGVCADGVTACRGGNIECDPIQTATTETCNDLDDDCDGNVDNGVTQACNTACGPGEEVCTAGLFGACIPTNPPAETCNGDDDDCDGMVDEDVPEVGTMCDTGALGPCGEGTYTCEAGSLKCEAGAGPTAETCDGEDNDCDGDTDEDANGIALTEDCGACPQGTRVCEGGQWSSCSQNNYEVCNSTDSNCDGRVDNDTACLLVCGDYTTIGNLECGAVPTCTAPPEICGDGIDNDCDGTIDQNCTNGLDDMAFVPAGRFILGSDTVVDPNAQTDETPRQTVTLDSFFIDRTEVSRAEYATCVTFGGCSLLQAGCPLQITQTQGPIGCVNWSQANAYCSWAGKRLPTEAEWERAARGGWNRDVLWPWGDSPTVANGVFDCTQGLVSCTANVDSYPQGASDDGLVHMAGNVAEWVSDYYSATAYTSITGANPEQTTDTGLGHVIRGGSYAQGISFGRVSNRARPAFFNSAAEIGFRCAKDAP